MGEILARFADGRLLVQEDKPLDTNYTSGGVPFRIGFVRTVEKVLSIAAHISGYPSCEVAVPLREVKVGVGVGSGPLAGGVSGTRRDIIIPILRRMDIGSPIMTGIISGVLGSGHNIMSGLSDGIISGAMTLTGPIGSGAAALSVLSGVTSGLASYGELTSGKLVSGRLLITANIIGF